MRSCWSHDLEFQTNVDSLSESLMPDLEAFDIDTERPAWTKIVSEVENIYQFVTEGKKIIIDRLLLPELSFGQKSDEIRLHFWRQTISRNPWGDTLCEVSEDEIHEIRKLEPS